MLTILFDMNFDLLSSNDFIGITFYYMVIVLENPYWREVSQGHLFDNHRYYWCCSDFFRNDRIKSSLTAYHVNCWQCMHVGTRYQQCKLPLHHHNLINMLVDWSKLVAYSWTNILSDSRRARPHHRTYWHDCDLHVECLLPCHKTAGSDAVILCMHFILIPEWFYMYIPAYVLSQAWLNKTVETWNQELVIASCFVIIRPIASNIFTTDTP